MVLSLALRSAVVLYGYIDKHSQLRLFWRKASFRYNNQLGRALIVAQVSGSPFSERS